MNCTYRWSGGVERLRTQGEQLPVQVLILPALFDEANRMRRFTVQLMAALATRGVGSLLPDLPGTGESPVDLATLGPTHWREAVDSLRAQFPEETRLTATIRGGALLGDTPRADARCWRLSPLTGAAVLRTLDRTVRAGGHEQGYPMAPAFRAALHVAEPSGPAHVVRLADDPAPADARLTGPPLWHRAEPGEDLALAEQAAADLAAWAAQA